MNNNHSSEFIEIMNNYLNYKVNKNKIEPKSIMSVIEESSREILKHAEDKEMIGIEKIHYDGLDNKSIANRVKYDKKNNHGIKKFHMKNLIKILNDNNSDIVITERTIDTHVMYNVKLNNDNKQNLKTNSKKQSKTTCVFDDHVDKSILPTIINKNDFNRISIILSSPKLRESLFKNIQVNRNKSDLNQSYLNSLNQNKNNYSLLNNDKINKSLRTNNLVNLDPIDYTKMLTRLVNQSGTKEVLRVIQKQKKVDNLISNIQEKEIRISASTKAALENMERRKRKEEFIDKKYIKLQKNVFHLDNFC